MTGTVRYAAGREQTIMLAIEADRRLAWAWRRGFLSGFGCSLAAVALGGALAMVLSL